MKKWVDAIVSGITSAIIFFISSAIITMLTSTTCVVYIGDSILLDNKETLTNIEIVNHSNKIINDIKIIIPGKYNNFFSSTPINFSIGSYQTATKSDYIQIESIREKSVTTLIVNYTQIDTTSQVYISNTDANNIEVSSHKDILDPFRKTINSIGLNSFIYFVFVTLFYYLMKKDSEKRNEHNQKQVNFLKEQQEVHLNRIEQLTEKQNDLAKRNEKNTRTYYKIKVLYIARITEYRKELDFWRNTLRSVMVNSKEADRLIHQISTSLKTQSTHQDYDAEFMNYLASVASVLYEKTNE